MQTEDDKTAYINLGNGHTAIVDLEDFPRLSRSRWFAVKREGTYYAMANITPDGVRKKIYMHHEVIGHVPAQKEVDHRNGNGLDNRKENLRTCSHKDNLRAHRKRNTKGTSKYKGVSWVKTVNKWRARIRHLAGKDKSLGLFESELDAARAYDNAALELFGEFATLNFPEPPKNADRLFPE